jgi:hypothetical protein
MARNLWVTVDGGGVERVRTDLPGRCGRGVGEEFGARKLNKYGGSSRLAQGKATPRMRLRVERVEARATNWLVYHCARLDIPAPEVRQAEFFDEV